MGARSLVHCVSPCMREREMERQRDRARAPGVLVGGSVGRAAVQNAVGESSRSESLHLEWACFTQS